MNRWHWKRRDYLISLAIAVGLVVAYVVLGRVKL
jgi:hypothetical protein